MKKHTLAAKVLWILFAVTVAVTLTLSIVAVLTEYEAGTNYFIPGNVIAPLAIAFGFLSVVCGIVAACLTKKEHLSKDLFPTNFHFPLTAIGFFCVAVLMLVSSALFAELLPASIARRMPIGSESLLGLISVPTLAIAGIYCILTGIAAFRAKQSLIVILGFFTVISAILLNAYYYFDFTVEMNAPVKVVLQMGLLMLMLCYTGELRYLLGIGKPKMYLILSVLGIVGSTYASAPILIAYWTGKLQRLDYVASAGLLLCFLLMQFARVIYLLRGIADEAPIESTSDSSENSGEQTEPTPDDHKEGI